MFSRLKTGWEKYFPPKPTFTEKDLPNLHGKVYIVTGANAGLGKVLSQILYSKNAKVYLAARSEEKTKSAIKEIQKAVPTSTGSLVYLHLDLSDLSTVKSAAEQFTSSETKLHVLWNNAGVMTPPQEKTAQGYEAHLGINNVAPFLFTKLLTPTLIATAKSEPPNTVRVVWVSSHATEYIYKPAVGISLNSLIDTKSEPPLNRYSLSKTGNYLHGTEYAKQHKSDGIISVPLNPGNLWTNLYNHQSTGFRMFARFISYPEINGAYTELFAGLSPAITIEKSGDWVSPFGRLIPYVPGLIKESKSVAEGGTGAAEKFWTWTEEQVKPYL